MDAVAPAPVERLHDERPLGGDLGQEVQVTRHPRAWNGNSRGVQSPRGHDLVLRGYAGEVRVQESRALLVQHSGKTQPQLGMGLQDVQVMVDRELLWPKEHPLCDADLDLTPPSSEDLEGTREGLVR